ncbi:MAG: hypothetical protein AAFU84_07000, partial [Cyanobacteria bacterium J06633_23]
PVVSSRNYRSRESIFSRLFPLVKVFTVKDLEKSLTDAGFVIDTQWQPDDYKSPIGNAKIVFIVAKKAE